ncbi:MAG: hypothetical protein ACKO3W_05520 [bacterium]
MRGKPLFWTIIAVFVTLSAVMSAISWNVFANVRANAATTDARLRELAWMVLAYADRNEAFPTSEAELRAFVGAPEGVPAALAVTAAEGAERTYPTTRAALGATDPAPTLDECFESIEVEWGLAGDVQPILRSKGKPTLQGTSPTVGQWLYAMSERIRGR